MSTATPPRSRGAAIAMIVLLLAAVQLVVISGLTGSSDEADSSVRRVLMTRARYAADGARLIMIRQFQRGFEIPAAGTEWTIGASIARVESAPVAPATGVAEIRAHADTSRRTIVVPLD